VINDIKGEKAIFLSQLQKLEPEEKEVLIQGNCIYV
jgi:hypothetical protein